MGAITWRRGEAVVSNTVAIPTTPLHTLLHYATATKIAKQETRQRRRRSATQLPVKILGISGDGFSATYLYLRGRTRQLSN